MRIARVLLDKQSSIDFRWVTIVSREIERTSGKRYTHFSGFLSQYFSSISHVASIRNETRKKLLFLLSECERLLINVTLIKTQVISNIVKISGLALSHLRKHKALPLEKSVRENTSSSFSSLFPPSKIIEEKHVR